jgi:hypothetical protein
MSRRPRFKVATSWGYAITQPPRQVAGHRVPGVTASVLDTACCHREVARYRSETHFGGGHWLGQEGALAAAQEHADRLNAEHA